MRKAIVVLFTATLLLFMAGCGSQSSVTTNPASGATVPVSLTVTDTPPSGVTVLFFQLSITGATLEPGDVSLLSSSNPIPVNVVQLQTEAAFLGSVNVAAGTYNSLNLTFANPQLTIYNASDSAIASTCAVGTVCQLTPSASSLMLSFSSTPFPIALTANSPLAFKLDIHLDKVIQPDLSVNLAATNGVTLSQLSSPPTGGPIPGLGKLRGTVQSVGANQFALQSLFGWNFNILVNGSTTYDGFPSSATCTTESFACLAQGQVVKVAVSLQSDGTLLATEVGYVQLASQETVEGNIIGLSASNGNTIMDLILQQGPSTSASSTLPLGHHVSVTVPSSGVTYAVDWGSFAPPTGVTLSFASTSDLEVGQEVQVVVQGTVTTSGGSGSNGTPGSPPVGPAGISFTTNSITLEPSQITGTVAATAPSSLSFTLSTFPAIFMPPSATPGTPPSLAPVEITVQTTSATSFTNFTTNSILGLAVNNVVSVNGWVFSTPSGPTATTVAADSVLLRAGVSPLF